MKIIQITAAYKPAYIYGGPTMSVAKLCESLIEARQGSWEVGKLGSWEEHHKSDTEQLFKAKDNNVEIEVFTTTANGKNELDVKPNLSKLVDGVKVTYFKRLTKDHTHFSPALLQQLSKMLRQAQRDKSGVIIHIHAWWNLVSLLSCAIAKWYQIPVLLSPRGMLTSYTQSNKNSLAKNIIHQLFGKNLLNYCHIHATSEQEKQDIQKIVTPKSITVIPNLVELEKNESLNANSGIEENISDFSNKNPVLPSPQGEGLGVRSFNLLFLSRIEEKKGLSLLFEALTLLDFNYTLTIAGTGDEAYINTLKIRAADLKINEQITWLGHVKNEDKFELLRKHDAMILSSYNENFANVVIESLSVGTPVIISNRVGLSNYVEQNQLGWITLLDTKSISSSIKRAYQDIEKRKHISALAPQLIESDFSDQNLAKIYINLYQDLANGRL